VTPPAGTVFSMLQRYQGSPDYLHLADSRRRDYGSKIAMIERKFGAFPPAALSDPRTRGIFLEWRDEVATSGRRNVDYTIVVFPVFCHGLWIGASSPTTRLRRLDSAQEPTKFGAWRTKLRSCDMRRHILVTTFERLIFQFGGRSADLYGTGSDGRDVSAPLCEHGVPRQSSAGELISLMSRRLLRAPAA